MWQNQCERYASFQYQNLSAGFPTFKDGSIGQVTDSGLLDHVADQEPLDGLVLGDATGTVGATDGLDVATTVL